MSTSHARDTGFDDASADEFWMRQALELARVAAERGDVPVGALVVRDGDVLGEGYDGKELELDPTAHAEVLAIRAAARRIADWRLERSTLYVTLEPCPMCAGALVHARVRRVVFGASNPRWGVISCGLEILDNPRFNHRLIVRGGVLAEESATLLRETFRAWRRAPESPQTHPE